MSEEKIPDEEENTANDVESASPLDDIRQTFINIRWQHLFWIVPLVAVAVYFLMGIYVVNPGEQAVIKRFGKILEERTAKEGVHYRLPWPIESVTRVNVQEVRRADVGIILPEHKHRIFPPEKIQLLTGDENFVNVEAIVQYRIKDAAKYLYKVNFNDERLVRSAVEAALIKLSGGAAVDALLTIEKLRAQTVVMRSAQDALDAYDSGLSITTFNIRLIVPPEEVADAFRDVQTAKQDKEKSINDAWGYYNSVIPEARGSAQKMISEAEAYRTEVVNNSRGEADRFSAMLAEYQKNRQIYSEDLTRYRLYLESMEKVLARMQKYIVNPTNKGEKLNLKFINAQ
ncbi:TPA: FtsH protease activity modulator HflK [Candidatus Poribacteria bacterium]|nr:FtsH protease activity modulator HflK [Candidatus Poribacteria bacterium]